MLLRCESLEPPMSQMGPNPDLSFGARMSPSAMNSFMHRNKRRTGCTELLNHLGGKQRDREG